MSNGRPPQVSGQVWQGRKRQHCGKKSTKSVRIDRCAKLLHCNVRRARTGTTRRRRTRRRPRAGLSSRSSATPAASTRTTKRRSKLKQGTGKSKPSAFIPLPATTGGVSSTAKLSVSKTDLLGSNPSSPASFPAHDPPGRGGARQSCNTAEDQSA